MKHLIKIKTFLLILALGLLTSCASSLKLSYDYDKSTNFTSYKTFSVYGLVTTLNINQFNAERIVSAIRREMIKKGFREDNTNADLVINALTILKDKQSLSASGYGGWYRPYSNVNIQSNHYKEGSLVIHLIDADSKQLIWEGMAYSEITKKPKDPEKTINEVVARILNGFPALTSNL